MLNLKDYQDKTIHFIGIGGCSMSGLALILNNLGYRVDGSDVKESPFTDVLKKADIPVHIGHDASLVEGAGLVVYSAAIKPSNPEYDYAVRHNIPMLERSRLLGLISQSYDKVICVSGCHGKTTITSMLALITELSGEDPTVHVGGMVDFLGGGVRIGQSGTFVTEACEYVRSFMTLQPTHIILNNIDDDHLDYFKDIDEIISTFTEFMNLLPQEGVIFANTDDANTRKALQGTDRKVISYSNGGNADYTMTDLTFDDRGCPTFTVLYHGEPQGQVSLRVPGGHNAMNALAAVALAHTVFGISIEESANALCRYNLTGRRFEKVGERDGVVIYHDYAHHPAEIQACLEAASRVPHRKLWVLFQCNSFTRARTLKDKYALSFEKADQVMVPDLYPGRDIDTGDIHATDLVRAIDDHSHNCIYLPTFQDIKTYLLANWQPGDMVVTLGSGDVYKQQMILLNK